MPGDQHSFGTLVVDEVFRRSIEGLVGFEPRRGCLLANTAVELAPLVGLVLFAVLLTALPQALASFEGWETVVFGAVLMLCMIFLPKGLVPTLAAKFGKGE